MPISMQRAKEQPHAPTEHWKTQTRPAAEVVQQHADHDEELFAERLSDEAFATM